MSRVTHRSIIKANTAIAVALRKHYAGKSLIVQGETWTAAAILAALAMEDELIAARDQAYAAFRKASRKARDVIVVNHQLRIGLREAVGVRHGLDPVVLNDFGFVFRKRRKATRVEKAVARQKLRATRAARGTMGRRQRKAAALRAALQAKKD